MDFQSGQYDKSIKRMNYPLHFCLYVASILFKQKPAARMDAEMNQGAKRK